MNISIAGVDLAKKVIQVCVVKRNTVLSNKEMTPCEFEEWLAKLKPMIVVFEACATSNYWKQTAEKRVTKPNSFRQSWYRLSAKNRKLMSMMRWLSFKRVS